jgi:two-component system KDP operon response regulator KdpE
LGGLGGGTIDMQALVVCEDPDELAILAVTVRRAGLGATVGEAVEPVLAELHHSPVDLILLALHDGSPEAQTRAVRRQTAVPLVVIAPQPGEEMLCRIYDAGADLVLPRPYSNRLLLMQVRAITRRGPGTIISSLPYLRSGELTLDPSNRAVQVEGRPPRRLTQLEFRLLYTLMMHRGQTLPASTLIERVWGYEGEGSSDLVRGLVRRLRIKVEPDPRKPRYIVTVPGLGYRLSHDEA